MKIQILSDFHYDCLPESCQETFVGKLISPEADYVVLAGDIAESTDLRKFMQKFNETGKKAIYVPGNHDHWHKDVNVFPDWVRGVFEGHHVLMNDFVIIDDIVFIGATFWTDISHPVNANAVQMGMMDFRRIRSISTNWWQGQHLNSKRYIEEALKFEQFKDLKKIVVTHHSPSFRTCPERFKYDGLNVAFHSNQDELLHEDYAPDLWIHGHVHDFCDQVIGNTRCIRNPFGYVAYGEKDTGYKDPFIIDTNDPNSYLHPNQRARRMADVSDSSGLSAEVEDVQSGL